MTYVSQSFRKMGRAPGFTAITVLCLALGIGANTAIFSLINTILLRPLPFFDVTRVVFLGEVFEPSEGQRVGLTAVSFQALRDRNQVFESVGAVQGADFALTGEDEPEYLSGALVTWDWLPTLGIEAEHGRTFLPEEDLPGQPADVVILGHDLWQRRFGGEDVLGQTILLDDRAREIVGILGRDTQYPYQAELWVPMGLDPSGPAATAHGLGVFGQMKPGVTLDEVRHDLIGIYRGLATRYPEAYGEWTFEMNLLEDELLRGMQPRLYLLLATVTFLLLIACANVASITLAKTQERTGEIGVRLAMGARRRHVIRQLLTESVLLAMIGGGIGLGLAYVGLRPLVVLSPIAAMNSFYQRITIDWRVLLFTLLLSAVVGIGFGLLPAIRSSRPDLQTTLKSSTQAAGTGRGGRRLLGLLVVFETAVAMVLLIGAGLMIDSVRRLQAEDPGFDTENLLTVRFALPDTRYADHQARLQRIEGLVEEIGRLPGVESAAAGGALPLATLLEDRRLAAGSVEGRPVESPNDFVIFNHRIVSPGYLRTLDIPLVSGRYFSSRDREGGRPVAIVNREAERRFWPGGAVGERVKRGPAGSENPWMTIVGVVDDVADHGLEVPPEEVGPTWYLPYTQHDFRQLALVARTGVPPRSLLEPIKELAAKADADLPLYDVQTMEERVADSYQAKQFLALLLSLFGTLGLVLAAAGIYGLSSYVVSRQRRDIGIRMAMGARAEDVQRLVLRRSMLLAGSGLALGLVTAAWLSRLLVRLFPDVDPGHVTTYVGTALGLLALALVASYLPARRATRVDPATVLRD